MLSLIDHVDAVDSLRPALLSSNDDDAVVTYGDLRHKSCTLARVIEERVAPGHCVGIAVCPSSSNRIVAMLGALRARRPYVALEMPSYPNAVVHHILKDSSVSLIVINSPDDDVYAQAVRDADFGIPFHQLEGMTTGMPSLVRDQCYPPLLPDAVITHVYTSGSSGLPKGVRITAGSSLFPITLISTLTMILPTTLSPILTRIPTLARA